MVGIIYLMLLMVILRIGMCLFHQQTTKKEDVRVMYELDVN